MVTISVAETTAYAYWRKRQPAGAGAGAMLVACRLAGLSALEGHYAGVRACTQFGPRRRAAI
jgi:hypothetical protein